MVPYEVFEAHQEADSWAGELGVADRVKLHGGDGTVQEEKMTKIQV